MQNDIYRFHKLLHFFQHRYHQKQKQDTGIGRSPVLIAVYIVFRQIWVPVLCMSVFLACSRHEHCYQNHYIFHHCCYYQIQLHTVRIASMQNNHHLLFQIKNIIIIRTVYKFGRYHIKVFKFSNTDQFVLIMFLLFLLCYHIQKHSSKSNLYDP